MDKIYCLENKVTGDKYVGFTSREVDERVKEHFINSKKPIYHVHNAIAKYGEDAFVWYLLYEGVDALEREDEFIRMHGTYNMCSGGNLPPNQKGKPRTKKHCENLSKALRGIERKPRDQNGINNPMYGKTPWNKGKKASPETREKQRLAKLGKSRTFTSPEKKLNYIESCKKENLSPIRRKNISDGVKRYWKHKKEKNLC